MLYYFTVSGNVNNNNRETILKRCDSRAAAEEFVESLRYDNSYRNVKISKRFVVLK